MGNKNVGKSWIWYYDARTKVNTEHLPHLIIFSRTTIGCRCGKIKTLQCPLSELGFGIIYIHCPACNYKAGKGAKINLQEMGHRIVGFIAAVTLDESPTSKSRCLSRWCLSWLWYNLYAAWQHHSIGPIPFCIWWRTQVSGYQGLGVSALTRWIPFICLPAQLRALSYRLPFMLRPCPFSNPKSSFVTSLFYLIGSCIYKFSTGVLTINYLCNSEYRRLSGQMELCYNCLAGHYYIGTGSRFFCSSTISFYSVSCQLSLCESNLWVTFSLKLKF